MKSILIVVERVISNLGSSKDIEGKQRETFDDMTLGSWTCGKKLRYLYELRLDSAISSDGSEQVVAEVG